jgi:hypothetical protein
MEYPKGAIPQHKALATGAPLTEVPVEKMNPGYQGQNKIVQPTITRKVGTSK